MKDKVGARARATARARARATATATAGARAMFWVRLRLTCWVRKRVRIRVIYSFLHEFDAGIELGLAVFMTSRRYRQADSAQRLKETNTFTRLNVDP